LSEKEKKLKKAPDHQYYFSALVRGLLILPLEGRVKKI